MEPLRDIRVQQEEDRAGAPMPEGGFRVLDDCYMHVYK